MKLWMLMLTTALFTLIAAAPMAEEDGVDNIVKWEKASRNDVPRTKKKVPQAEELVVRANSLLRGDPTCNQMLEASKLLEQAVDIYENADVPWKAIQKVARRMISLEGLAKVGKCRQ
jgi:hypothetical protein